MILEAKNNTQTPQQVNAFSTEGERAMSSQLRVDGEDTKQQAALSVAEKETESCKETKEAPSDTSTQGMQCDIKNLYQKEDKRGRCTWTEEYPGGLDEAAENEITARYAILVRNKKSFDPRKKLEVDSIVIQSPLLKEVLGKVLKDYPGKHKPP